MCRPWSRDTASRGTAKPWIRDSGRSEAQALHIQRVGGIAFQPQMRIILHQVLIPHGS
jgi:hypothetical protein